LLLLLLGGCGAPSCPGLPAEPPIDRGVRHDGADHEALDRRLSALVVDHCVPALSVAIVDPSGVRWSGAYGWADLKDETPATVDTAFAVASSSKLLVGVATMLAIEDGALRLDDPVSEHLPFEVHNPRHGSSAPPIRVEHLVTHSSSIADGPAYDASYVDGDPDTPLTQFLEAYLTRDGEHYRASRNFHNWVPGRQWMYSNVAAATAAATIAAATGTPYDDFTRARVFAPLGMDHTWWFLGDIPEEQPVARPHAVVGSRDEPAWDVLEHYGFPTWPDGQLRTTAADLGRLLAAAMAEGELDGQRILEPESVRTMLTPPVRGLDDWYFQSLFGVFSDQYVAWIGREADDGRSLIGHDGGDDGVISLAYYDPEARIGAVVITNVASAGAVAAAGEAHALLLEAGEDAWSSR